MKCPKCGKEMVGKRYTHEILLSKPAQYPWNWVCVGCGHEFRGGADTFEKPKGETNG